MPERDPLLTTRVGEHLQLDRVASALNRPGLTPYLTPLLGWVLDILVLSTVSYVVLDRAQFDALGVWVIPVGIVVGVRLAKWLRERYHKAVQSLPGDELDADALLAVPRGRLRVALFVAFLVGNYVQLLLSPGEVAAFVAVHGEAVAYAKYAFVTPLYMVLFADLAALLAASLVVLPVRVYRANLSLDFSDVKGFAGLYEVGRLLSAGAVAYFAGLAAWTVFLVLPSIVGANDVSAADSVLFSGLWVLGVLLYVAPVLLLHRHMSRAKEAEVEAIDRDIRELDPAGDARGIPYLEPSEEDIPRLQQKFVELQQVRHAREYPANTAIVEELALAALVPVAFQWGLSNATLLL